MDKVRNIFYKSLIFFCLAGLLLASSHISSCIVSNQSNTKKEIGQKQKADFVLKSVNIEATVNCVNINLQQAFYFISKLSKPVLQQFIAAQILSPKFIDQLLVILFTRISPTQAP